MTERDKSQEFENRIDFLDQRLTNQEYQSTLLTFEFVRNFDAFLNYLTPSELKNGKLIRIGPISDGGYVISDHALETQHNHQLISIGIGNEFEFELKMMEIGYSVLAIDGSIENPFVTHSNVSFSKVMVCGKKTKDYRNQSGRKFKTYEEILYETNTSPEIEILKIDVEGFEYEILESCTQTIKKARQIILEFHGLEMLLDSNFAKKVLKILSELTESHKVIHVHGNNAGRTISFPHGYFPSLLEVSLARKDLCEKRTSKLSLPSELDYPNTRTRPDIDLSPFFSEPRTYLGVLQNILDGHNYVD